MANRYLDAIGLADLMIESIFPQTCPTVVATSPIAENEEFRSSHVQKSANILPPPAQLFREETRSLMRSSYIDIPLIVFEVVNAERNSFTRT